MKQVQQRQYYSLGGPVKLRLVLLRGPACAYVILCKYELLLSGHCREEGGVGLVGRDTS